MTSKKFSRDQMQRCLDVLDALAQSGLNTEEFAQTQGLSYGQLRAWLSHGPRWRAQLADPSYVAPSRCKPSSATGFAQVKVGDAMEPKPSAPANGLPGVRIDCSQGGRSVVLHWPTGAPLACAQWLKAYLA